MQTNSEQFSRRSIRLKDYDYSQNGAYFLTICVHNKHYLFGEIVNHKMQLNKAGEMINHHLMLLPEKFPYLDLGEYIVMPNHLHAIIILNKPNIGSLAPTTIGEVVGTFKSITLCRYIEGIKNNSWPFKVNKLWQRNYYEHVIRNYRSLYAIREYIVNNPLSWELDRMNLALKFKRGQYM